MKIFTFIIFLMFSFGLLSQSKKDRIEQLSQKIDSIYKVDSLKNINILFLKNKINELNEQNKILNRTNENYKNELSNLELRLYNDSLLSNKLKIKSIYLENQLSLLNDSLQKIKVPNSVDYSLYADNFIKQELRNDMNVDRYHINHLIGDINLDGQNDMLIYYGEVDKELGALSTVGWCIVFFDNNGIPKNYLIFRWSQTRCSSYNSRGLGVPIKIINSVIYLEKHSYDKNDACCCPSIKIEDSVKFNGNINVLESKNTSTKFQLDNIIKIKNQYNPFKI